MTGRVLVTDYAWPDLRVETAVLAEAGIEMVVTDTPLQIIEEDSTRQP